MDRVPLPRVVWVVWAIFGFSAVAVFATYGRVPVHELYHVSRSGTVGGLSRIVVLSNFPIALVAVACAGIAADRIGRRDADVLAVAAVGLCAVVAVPGVVDQADLDASWKNAAAAVGVALALLLTVWAARAGHVDPPRLLLDRARLALAAVALVAGPPWLLAELGVSVSDIPLLRHVFLGNQHASGEELMAVHLGHHHGVDGLYLVLTALLLSRTLPMLRRRGLRGALSAYLALMLVYGSAQVLQDGWTEQVVKRGWTDRSIPDLLHPALSLWWAALLALAAVVEVAAFRRERSGGRALADPEAVERALNLDEPDDGAHER